MPRDKTIILEIKPATPICEWQGSIAIGIINNVYNRIWNALLKSFPPGEGKSWKPPFL